MNINISKKWIDLYSYFLIKQKLVDKINQN